MPLNGSGAAHADARLVFALCRDRNNIPWILLYSLGWLEEPPEMVLTPSLKKRFVSCWLEAKPGMTGISMASSECWPEVGGVHGLTPTHRGFPDIFAKCQG